MKKQYFSRKLDRVFPSVLNVAQRVLFRILVMLPDLNLHFHSILLVTLTWESGTNRANGLTMLVVTHDPNVARRANRVIVLADGQILKRVKGEELSAGSMPLF